MTEQISKKRIEELARWLGFSWHEQREYVHGPLMHGGEYIDGHWDYRGSCHYDIGDGMGSKIHIPDFPNDIAACEKWILADVQDWLLLRSNKKYQAFLIKEGTGFGEAESPATAIFLAAERLKKAEVEKSTND